MTCLTWTIPAILTGTPAAAAPILSEYFTRLLPSGADLYYTGAMFERFGGGGDRPEIRDLVTVEDLVAVSMLAVDVPAQAALRILDDDAADISALLSEIPDNVDLVNAPDNMIDQCSAAWELWNLLDGYYKMGPTTTSKLMARKRPRLIPVEDAQVMTALGKPTNYWDSLRHYLGIHGHSLWLRQVRALSGVGRDISEIRVFDVLVWMTRGGRLPVGVTPSATPSLSPSPSPSP